MKNSLSSYVRNTALRPAGLSRGSSSSEAFWNAPFSLSNSSIFSPVNCWNTRGFVLASSYFIFFPPLPSFYSLLHAFPIDSMEAEFALDALVEYGVEEVSQEVTRPNPERKRVGKERQQARAEVLRLRAQL